MKVEITFKVRAH